MGEEETEEEKEDEEDERKVPLPFSRGPRPNGLGYRSRR